MIALDNLLSILLRCRHRRLTRPQTPISPNGVPEGEARVTCLDCGARFAYDTTEMRIGKLIRPDQADRLP